MFCPGVSESDRTELELGWTQEERVLLLIIESVILHLLCKIAQVLY